MKRLVIFLHLLLIAGAGFSQNPTANASSFFAAGTLDKAKESIDQAIKNDKYKNDAKTWFLRGQIHKEIFTQVYSMGLPLYKKLAKGCVEESFKSFKKAIQFGDEEVKAKGKGENKYIKKVSKEYPELRGYLQSQGYIYYSTKSFDSAVTIFEYSLSIDSANLIPADVRFDTVLFHAGYFAYSAKNYQKTIKYMEAAKAKGYTAGTDRHIALATKELGDTMKAVAILKDAISKTPDDVQLLIDLVNILLQAKKTQEAEEFLDKAIANDPKNYSFYFVKGTMAERRKDINAAELNYEKAIELKPDYFDAIYNLGALFYNTGKEIIKEASKLSTSESNKYNAEMAKAHEQIDKAIPHLEDALKIAPNDIELLQTLYGIYTFKNMKEKSDAIKAQLEKANSKNTNK